MLCKIKKEIKLSILQLSAADKILIKVFDIIIKLTVNIENNFEIINNLFVCLIIFIVMVKIHSIWRENWVLIMKSQLYIQFNYSFILT